MHVGSVPAMYKLISLTVLLAREPESCKTDYSNLIKVY